MKRHEVIGAGIALTCNNLKPIPQAVFYYQAVSRTGFNPRFGILNSSLSQRLFSLDCSVPPPFLLLHPLIPHLYYPGLNAHVLCSARPLPSFHPDVGHGHWSSARALNQPLFQALVTDISAGAFGTSATPSPNKSQPKR